jgi:hypothetical protein
MRWISAAVLVAVLGHGAFAQAPSSDMALRAAFCRGVLDALDTTWGSPTPKSAGSSSGIWPSVTSRKPAYDPDKALAGQSQTPVPICVSGWAVILIAKFAPAGNVPRHKQGGIRTFVKCTVARVSSRLHCGCRASRGGAGRH